MNTGHATALLTSTGDKLPNEIKTPTMKNHLQVENVDAFFSQLTSCKKKLAASLCSSYKPTDVNVRPVID